MKITEILRRDPTGFSLEFFPPITCKGEYNLQSRISRLKKTSPRFVSVTWGAGGSSSQKSFGLCKKIQKEQGLEALLHISATNFSPEEVIAKLEEALECGIQNLLVLRGDASRQEEYSAGESPKAQGFQYASELVQFIRDKFHDKFCIGVGAYPETHPESANEERDLFYLKKKVECGADFIMTQFFFDADKYVKWVGKVRALGLNQPIIPEVMIIQSSSSFYRLLALTQVKVPDHLRQELRSVSKDDEAVKALGVRTASQLILKLKALLPNPNDLACLHICTFNLENSVKQVLEQVGWISNPSPTPQTKEVLETMQLLDSLGLWDDHPNGRFGVTASPAFGDVFGHGTIKGSDFKAWGLPQSKDDISALCISFLTGALASLPWAEKSEIESETESIASHLLSLNHRGYWTLASQPAVDAAPSSHPVYGWGPQTKGGYVFQKAFVELMIPTSLISALSESLKPYPAVTFMAIDQGGNFQTSITSDPEKLPACTLTWGVFPHREIIQSTLVEEENLRVWGAELFQIWEDWAKLYPPTSPSAILINDIKQSYSVINLIHNDYKLGSDPLFDILEKVLP
ncbi:methylenetetrahydrofolate reductase 1 [Entomophthora muscae]|uniref:Methylenetetrahydrofolate reductase 1 n=1 Tax=Entomophthora muscae TaxID=34485 RepID=A0ACC2S0W5_9FUNG|nr:methylenetetrahydrofolate reductase 1 [Entomophthora muscae]